MYTIKQAAARTGLTMPTIRAWERRYGVVHPERTAAGYRLYDDAAIDRLIAMRTSSNGGLAAEPGRRTDRDAGHGPVVAGGSGHSVGRVHRRGSRPRRRIGREPSLGLRRRRPALDFDAMERILDEAFAAQRFELAMEPRRLPRPPRRRPCWADGESMWPRNTPPAKRSGDASRGSTMPRAAR